MMTPRQQIDAVRAAALMVHKQLIDAARVQRERELGQPIAPNEMLRLLTTEPSFAWLQPLTRAIVEADEKFENLEPSAEHAAEFRSRIEQILEKAQLQIVV